MLKLKIYTVAFFFFARNIDIYFFVVWELKIGDDIFLKKLLVNFTNNYIETSSNTLNLKTIFPQ